MTDTGWALMGLGIGALGAVVIWTAGRAWLRAERPGSGVLESDGRGPRIVRNNHAGRPVPVTGGLVVVAASLLSLGLPAVVKAAGGYADAVDLLRFGLPVGVVVGGFGFLGLVDDAFGGDDARGFSGHLSAAGSGRVTTGMVKLAGGGAVALVAVAPRGGGVWWLLMDAAVVALSANLANLLDRAPGRLLKASLVAAVPLCAVGWRGPELAAAAPVLGASWAMLPPDLREETMLGDAGANVVGATLGWLAVELAGAPARGIMLAVLVLANASSEFVSFTRVIGAVPPLRWFDALGRRPV